MTPCQAKHCSAWVMGTQLAYWNPGIAHCSMGCPLHGWIYSKVSWCTQTTVWAGNCKELFSLTTQTDAKYLKSCCKSASYSRFTRWLNGDNSALQRTRTKFLRCRFNDSTGFAEALPGCAAQPSSTVLRALQRANSHSDSVSSHRAPLHLLSLQQELKITI